MRISLSLLAFTGSLGLLLGAFAFQYIGDMAPCKMCIWQRWPHAFAIIVGGYAYVAGNRPLKALAALVVLIGAMIALYHAGVEQGWWTGPATCTSGPIGDLTTEELMAQIQNAPLVRCDEIPWSLFGLSMAAWNGVLSLILAGLWAWSARRG